MLELRQVHKSFPGVRALQNVSLTLRKGQVLALMGENGAGKSTLIRMLGGAHQPDTGEIAIDGKTVRLDSPLDAIQAGIGVIYQELTLIPALSVCDNLFLGRSRNRFWIRRHEERQRAQEVFRRMGVQIPLDVPLRTLSIAQQQLVEIARVLAHDVRILVMDEPSAVLTPAEVNHLFAIIRELKSQGISVIYISHRLEEVFEIADSVTVLRDGLHIADCEITGLTRARLIELMVGRPLEREHHRRSFIAGTPILAVDGLSRGTKVRHVSFTIRPGEIVALTGLVGAGRTETARLIFGADRRDAGKIIVNGRAVEITSPRQAIQAGICLLTEDRKSEGLVPGRSVRENFSLASLPEFQAFGFVKTRKELDTFHRYVTRLNLRITSPEQQARTLSGGNQQKLLLARWLQTEAQVFLLDEPTRGVDIGARQEIYRLIEQLAQRGKAILLISSDLPEVLSLADTILVMRSGRISGQLQNGPDVTQEQILDMAAG